MLWWSLRAFRLADPDIRQVVVIPEGYDDYWRQLLLSLPWEDRIPHEVCFGGASRSESVARGLAMLPDVSDRGRALVAVHDGARPLVSPELIRRGFAAADVSSAAIPVVPVTDSLRELLPEVSDISEGMEIPDPSKAVDRSRFVAVQTPQVFDLRLLRDCYGRLSSGSAPTDDASVVELFHPVALFEGDPRNIKVTNPVDFEHVHPQ